MTGPARSPADYRRDAVSFLFLLLVFIVVYAANLSSLRLGVRDRAMLTRLQAILGSGGTWSIVDNSWDGEPRAYFISWLVRGCAALAFGYAAMPHFALGLVTHFAASALVYRILRGGCEDEALALGGAVLYLVFPTASCGLFLLTNWAYVFSGFVFVSFLFLLLSPRGSAAQDVVCLSAVALVGQFAGEQAIPLYYLSFAGAGIHAWRAGGGFLDRRFLRCVIPCLFCIASLALYGRLFIRPYQAPCPAGGSWHTLASYVWGFLIQAGSSLYPGSSYYGRFSVHPGRGTLVSAAILSLIVIIAFSRMRGASERKGPAFPPSFLVFLGLGVMASVVPCLIGASHGLRPHPLPRYLFIPGLLAAAALPVLADRMPPRWRRGILIAACISAGSLMIYLLRDVWGTQKMIDERIWGAIEARLDPRVRYLLLVNPDSETFMPGGYSSADTDFRAGRLGYAIHSRVDVMAMSAWDGSDGDREILRDWRGRRVLARGSEILTVAFRPGARFSDLVRSPLAVYRDFDEYRSLSRPVRQALP